MPTRITARDLELLAWLARFRLATAAQIAARFGLSERVAYRRLAGLVAHGLVTHRYVMHGEPGAYLVTRDGLALAGVGLATAGVVDLKNYRHDLALVDLAGELEAGGTTVVTERELRRLSLDGGTPFVLSLPANERRDAERHVPDLVVKQEDEARGVELELTQKAGWRLQRILRGYVGARALAGVTYYAGTQTIADAVQRAVEAVKASSLVEIRPFRSTGSKKSRSS